MLPEAWPAGGIEPLKGGHEPRQVHRRFTQVADAVDGRGLGPQPGADRLAPRVLLGGASDDERGWDSE